MSGGIGRPPVSEVVLSVAIEEQAALLGPRLPEVLGSWYLEHPNLQQVPPYELPSEPPPGQLRTEGPRIEFLGGAPKPRFWFTSSDDVELLQVQDDYLALNWRRRQDNQTYPGYENLRSRFEGLLTDVDRNMRTLGAGLAPLRGEVTYINVIEPNVLWSSTSQVAAVIDFRLPISEYEQLGFQFSTHVNDDEGQVGRLHVTVAPGWDATRGEPRIGITLTARSFDLRKRDIGDALRFLNQAHSALGDTFKALLTPEARDLWELS